MGTFFEIEPGKGNLDARALWAATVGPYRLTHGTNKTYQLVGGTPKQVASNPGSTEQVMFVGVALQATTPGPILALFSRTADVMGNANVPAQLQQAIGQLGGISYSAVLLPGEELYVMTYAAANIVSFTVGF